MTDQHEERVVPEVRRLKCVDHLPDVLVEHVCHGCIISARRDGLFRLDKSKLGELVGGNLERQMHIVRRKVEEERRARVVRADAVDGEICKERVLVDASRLLRLRALERVILTVGWLRRRPEVRVGLFFTPSSRRARPVTVGLCDNALIRLSTRVGARKCCVRTIHALIRLHQGWRAGLLRADDSLIRAIQIRERFVVAAPFWGMIGRSKSEVPLARLNGVIADVLKHLRERR